MGEFAVFILIIFSAMWGSVVLATLLKERHRKLDARLESQLGSGLGDGELAEIHEELVRLSARMERMEDDVGFFTELNRPNQPAQLTEADRPGAASSESAPAAEEPGGEE
jgi:hypothetical protein